MFICFPSQTFAYGNSWFQTLPSPAKAACPLGSGLEYVSSHLLLPLLQQERALPQHYMGMVFRKLPVLSVSIR